MTIIVPEQQGKLYFWDFLESEVQYTFGENAVYKLTVNGVFEGRAQLSTSPLWVDELYITINTSLWEKKMELVFLPRKGKLAVWDV